MAPKEKKSKSSGNLLTTKNIGIIILILFIVLTLVYWLIPPNLVGRLSGYVSLIAFLATVLAIFSFFIAQQNSAEQARAASLATSLAYVQSTFTAFERYFADNGDMNNLYKRMNQGNKLLQILPDIEPITTEAKYKEIHVIAWAFQIVEDINDIVIARGLSWGDPELQPILFTFRSWFQDEQVKELWSTYYYQLASPSTQTFVSTF
jgi:hypothetical protein